MIFSLGLLAFRKIFLLNFQLNANFLINEFIYFYEMIVPEFRLTSSAKTSIKTSNLKNDKNNAINLDNGLSNSLANFLKRRGLQIKIETGAVLNLTTKDNLVSEIAPTDIYFHNLDTQFIDPRAVRLILKENCKINGLMIDTSKNDQYYFIFGLSPKILLQLSSILEEFCTGSKYFSIPSFRGALRNNQTSSKYELSSGTLVRFEEAIISGRDSYYDKSGDKSERDPKTSRRERRKNWISELKIPKPKNNIEKTTSPFNIKTQRTLGVTRSLNRNEQMELEFIKCLQREKLTRQENEILKNQIKKINKENENIIKENVNLKEEISEISSTLNSFKIKLQYYKKAEQDKISYKNNSTNEILKMKNENMKENEKKLIQELKKIKEDFFSQKNKFKNFKSKLQNRINEMIEEKRLLEKNVEGLKSNINVKDEQFLSMHKELENLRRINSQYKIENFELKEKFEEQMEKNGELRSKLSSFKHSCSITSRSSDRSVFGVLNSNEINNNTNYTNNQRFCKTKFVKELLKVRKQKKTRRNINMIDKENLSNVSNIVNAGNLGNPGNLGNVGKLNQSQENSLRCNQEIISKDFKEFNRLMKKKMDVRHQMIIDSIYEITVNLLLELGGSTKRDSLENNEKFKWNSSYEKNIKILENLRKIRSHLQSSDSESSGRSNLTKMQDTLRTHKEKLQFLKKNDSLKIYE